MNEVLQQLQELKELALLGAKTALTMNDVCLLAGISKSHLYKLVWSKKIPYYKSEGGKMTYFNKQEIENWLLAYRVPTEAELEQKAIAHCVTNDRKGARR
ncbi:MAG: helix-turn-helix domain-containing protein [Bacteroidales bacterium]|nr:helix-turn-helix domain-containing protein [Bacteroidales bacterium]